jgi:two-component sensor histidine kinase
MADSKKPSVWGLASEGEIEAALRGVGVALSTQDAGLNYTAGINLPLSAEAGDIAGLSDEQLYLEARHELRHCKERVRASGKGERVDIRMVRGNDTDWYRVWVEPLHQDGSQAGLFSASVAITELKTTEELLRLALLELAHRSKNLLAVVLSIARQSADESHTLPDFSQRFIGRIRSLALAHDVLTDESWRGATVFSLVRSQLSAFSESALAQSAIEGHNAYLKPNAVQYVGLALHELIAMSLISGALSVPEGRLVVTSALAPTDEGGSPDLSLRWHESGMPVGKKLEKSRFGDALLEQIVPAALAGKAELDVSEERALTYRLRIPATQFF